MVRRALSWCLRSRVGVVEEVEAEACSEGTIGPA
jgi:hypothetical protein